MNGLIPENEPLVARGWSRRALLAALGASLVPGCGSAGSGRAAGRKKVLTTFTILADMARNVAGEVAGVASVTKPGAEIHGYEPTPQDIVAAQSADLVLWNGLNLELWFERFFEKVQRVPRAVLTEGIEPMSITEGPYTGKPNPHAWMAPANAVIYVENIRRALVNLDPANEAAYTNNASVYVEKIKSMDAPVRRKLEQIPPAQRWLATSEGAFSYLCRNYGLKQLYLWPINADAQGTPQQVQHVIDMIRKNKIPVIFSESTVSDKPARQVARETGAKYGGVLYVDSLTDEKGSVPTYLKLLEYNAETIVKAFLEEGASR
jgi:manganese/iron transport system substrate-binding protein